MGIVVDPAQGLAFGITSGASQKVANLRRDPRVAVCQVDRGRWSTIEGAAEVLTDRESVADAVRRYAERYRQPRENPERVAVRITITRVIGNV
jgi:PPOX class probable F420-dependent enzyme